MNPSPQIPTPLRVHRAAATGSARNI